jgi:hypothetical protein
MAISILLNLPNGVHRSPPLPGLPQMFLVPVPMFIFLIGLTIVAVMPDIASKKPWSFLDRMTGRPVKRSTAKTCNILTMGNFAPLRSSNPQWSAVQYVCNDWRKLKNSVLTGGDRRGPFNLLKDKNGRHTGVKGKDI